MGNPAGESTADKRKIKPGETVYMIRHRCTNRNLNLYIWEMVEKKVVSVKDSVNGTKVFLGKGKQNFMLANELVNNTRIAEMDEENMLTWDYFRGTDKALRKAERWLKTANANHAGTPQ